MRYRSRQILITATALVLAAALAACGSSKKTGADAGKGYNQTDVAFVAPWE